MKLARKYFIIKCGGLILLSSLGLVACSTLPDAKAPAVNSATAGVAMQTGTRGGDKWMPLGSRILAPTGFLEMCERSPQDCAAAADQDTSVIRVEAEAMLARKTELAYVAVHGASEDVSPASTRRATSDTPRLRRLVHKSPQVTLVALNDYVDAGETVQPLTGRTVQLREPKQPRVELKAFAWANESTGAWQIFPSGGDDVASQQTNSSTVDFAETGAPDQGAGRPLEIADNMIAIGRDRDALKILQRVNGDVNAMLVSDTDQDIYNVNDYWNAPGLAKGNRADCEDYALQKRRELVRLGMPAAAMGVAIVRTRAGESHAVLVVATTDGDYVLDNLSYSVKRWNQTGYTWISRQLATEGLTWVSLRDTEGR
ncbi:transglutaminase-like cysteine peptidase [Asticcacaulis sp. 201]|uniref:transglutaminase-like cysteine peptidase n=1 Tax=Asticcacaulis sp. 201 TaxID=3028787 RepID=UPI00291662F0|nr:transglutaminase-like cysteine peptidase [Asticcacaulis sp. 201]MDV6331077.1 transglutaminase-like cysteine peptidase [Asticcacaulis sp. 201]